jgi:cell division protein FtsI (penicillin-binding protein 3)
VKPNTLIDIEDGRFRIGRRTINDTHPKESLLTVTDIIQRSSNVGTAKISLMMKPEHLWEVLSDSGFGQLPTNRFPRERLGVPCDPRRIGKRLSKQRFRMVTEYQ